MTASAPLSRASSWLPSEANNPASTDTPTRRQPMSSVAASPSPERSPKLQRGDLLVLRATKFKNNNSRAKPAEQATAYSLGVERSEPQAGDAYDSPSPRSGRQPVAHYVG